MALALIAGEGALPGRLAEALVARGEAPVICVFNEMAPDVPAVLPRLEFRLETLGTLIALLKGAEVDRLCMAGAVRRVPLDTGRIDALTAPLVPRLSKALTLGDDGALRVVVGLFEEAGIAVVGPTDILPDLLPPVGVPTRARPLARHEADARAGAEALVEMGRRDLGQAVILRDGAVLAREGAEGTAALIASIAPAPPEGSSGAGDPFGWAMDAVGDMLDVAADWLSASDRDAARAGAGAVLYKAPKPGQDRRVDLPLIGPETAVAAAAAGLDGIILEAGGVMVLDLPRVVETLDRCGMFLWIRAA